MKPFTKILLELLSQCSEETQRRAILLLNEYGIKDRDLTNAEVGEAGAMLADLIEQDGMTKSKEKPL